MTMQNVHYVQIIIFIDSKTNDQNMRVLNSFMITLLEGCLLGKPFSGQRREARPG